MSYRPTGSQGLNDFADEILSAGDGDSTTHAAVIVAAAIYRVGAQLVDCLDLTRRALNDASNQLEYIQLKLSDGNSN